MLNLYSLVNCLTISTAIQSLTRAEVTISNTSDCFVPVAQASSPAGFSSNKSRLHANCENPPEDFRATFEFDTQYTLSLRDVNIVAIEAMYRLSLQSWESSITRSLEYHLSPHAVLIYVPTSTRSPPVPYSFVISGLYAGVLFLHDRASRTGTINELRVNLLRRSRPIGVVKILRKVSTGQGIGTRPSRPNEPANVALRLVNSDSGTYVDPENRQFSVLWRNYGPLIHYNDVYLAILNGLAEAARLPTDAACWRFEAVASRRATPSPPRITLSSTRHPGNALTYRYAARAMQIITTVMEHNGWFGEMTFDLVYGGERIGRGSLEPYYRGQHEKS